MTFKGQSYSSILDLEVLIIIWEANLKALKIEFKYYQVTRDIVALQETQVKINAYEQGIKELQELEESLIEKIDALNTENNDLQSQIFILKFIKGYSNDRIMEELHISKTSMFVYFDKIDKQLENTSYGKRIKEQLSE
jgi:hypothetical protein